MKCETLSQQTLAITSNTEHNLPDFKIFHKIYIQEWLNLFSMNDISIFDRKISLEKKT